MRSSNRGGGWILLAIILIGAGLLYQREGGKIFGPHLPSPPRPVSTDPTPAAGGPDQREAEAMNSEADRLNHRALQLRRENEELELEIRHHEDALRQAQEKERQKQMDQAAEESFRYEQKRAADLGEAIRKALEEKY